MGKKTIDAESLLAWAQSRFRRESPFLYPNPQVILEAGQIEFWDFVLAQTGMSVEELNSTLDRLFPEEPVYHSNR